MVQFSSMGALTSYDWKGVRCVSEIDYLHSFCACGTALNVIRRDIATASKPKTITSSCRHYFSLYVAEGLYGKLRRGWKQGT